MPTRVVIQGCGINSFPTLRIPIAIIVILKASIGAFFFIFGQRCSQSVPSRIVPQLLFIFAFLEERKKEKKRPEYFSGQIVCDYIFSRFLKIRLFS